MYHGRLTPYVRFAKTIRCGPDYPKPLYAYDHRLIYMLEGDMGLVFEKQSYRLSRDSVAVFPPALAYKLMDNRKEGNEYVILNFDFHDARRGTTPHPPDDAKSFRSEEIFSAESFPPFHKPVVLERAEYLRSPLHEICREEENGQAGIRRGMHVGIDETCSFADPAADRGARKASHLGRVACLADTCLY